MNFNLKFKIYLELRQFFYSCLLLFFAEKQAVIKMVCKSWLLEPDFLSTGDFILASHPL